MNLFSSGHYQLTEIRASGKKRTGGILCFKGIPSVFGSGREVLAIEDGVVLAAGRSTDPCSREYRIGTYVRIAGRNGVAITYGRLSCRFVKAGTYVKAGTCIGITGSTGSGSGEYLTLEFRRNGRRVDGCSYLGIPHEPAEFTPPIRSKAELVSLACGLDDEMRAAIDSAPRADKIWGLLAAHLKTVEPGERDSSCRLWD